LPDFKNRLQRALQAGIRVARHFVGPSLERWVSVVSQVRCTGPRLFLSGLRDLCPEAGLQAESGWIVDGGGEISGDPKRTFGTLDTRQTRPDCRNKQRDTGEKASQWKGLTIEAIGICGSAG